MDPNKAIELLTPFVSSNRNHRETYTSVQFDLDGNQLAVVADLWESLETESKDGALSVFIDGESVSKTDLASWASASQIKELKLTLNKTSLKLTDAAGKISTFFCFKESFVKWLQDRKPFSSNDEFFLMDKMYVNGLDKPFNGVSFFIVPPEWKAGLVPISGGMIPESVQIATLVRVKADSALFINPQAFLFETDSNDEEISAALRKNAVQSLAASVVSELKSNNLAIIDGHKLLEIPLANNSDIYTKALYDKLLSLVEWLFQEGSSTRQKLFLERLSLEVEYGKSLIETLISYIDEAFAQAKNRYDFIILEKKEKYTNELKDVLKDLRAQSDLYAQKLRTLLSNFLRDALATLILLGFAVFTKVGDIQTLRDSNLLGLVFYALAGYFAISLLYQAVTDWSDVVLSGRELNYWSTVTKELISRSEFDQHAKKVTQWRKRTVITLYIATAFLYLVMIGSCLWFADVYSRYLIETMERQVVVPNR